jgi:hypothetical protein
MTVAFTQSFLFALQVGLHLNIHNINAAQITRAGCQMLIHLLELSHADDNNDEVELVVGPGDQEANAKNHINLLNDLDDNSDEELAYIDGMLDGNG